MLTCILCALLLIAPTVTLLVGYRVGYWVGHTDGQTGAHHPWPWGEEERLP